MVISRGGNEASGLAASSLPVSGFTASASDGFAPWSTNAGLIEVVRCLFPKVAAPSEPDCVTLSQFNSLKEWDHQSFISMTGKSGLFLIF